MPQSPMLPNNQPQQADDADADGLGAVGGPNVVGGSDNGDAGPATGQGPQQQTNNNPQQAKAGPAPPSAAPEPPPADPEVGELTHEQLDEWIHMSFEGWLEGLSSAEKKALRELKEGHLDNLSLSMRVGRRIPEKAQQPIKFLDAAISRAKLPHDVVAYKVVKLPDEIEDLSFLQGKTFCDYGYCVATLDQNLLSSASLQKGWVLATLMLPRDFPAAPLDLIYQKRQYAVALPRSSKFTVVLVEAPNALNSGILTLEAQTDDVGDAHA
jgi:hypothetical protein